MNSARECPFCDKRMLEKKYGEFRFNPPENVGGGVILVRDSTWYECSNCGECILSPELDTALDREQNRRVGLLSPEKIKEIRKRAGLTQQEIAALLGVGAKNFTRWESGKSIQNRSSDNLIRIFEKDPSVFERLKAVRDPSRSRQISEYFQSLSTLKGRNPIGMAAHGDFLETAVLLKFRDTLAAIASVRKTSDD